MIRSDVRALSTLLIGLWTIAGCTEEPITFRAEQQQVPAPPMAEPEQPDAGRPRPPGTLPSLQPDAQSPPQPEAPPEPSVTEFDLSAPPGGRSSMTDPGEEFVASCDASLCTCRINAECPLVRPLCNFLGYCVECFSSEDCLRKVTPGLAVCDRGECRGCASDQECPMGWQCQAQSCIEFCDDNRDCPPDWFCRNGTCDPGQSSQPDTP
jgi:hypothetical protein